MKRIVFVCWLFVAAAPCVEEDRGLGCFLSRNSCRTCVSIIAVCNCFGNEIGYLGDKQFSDNPLYNEAVIWNGVVM